MLAVPAASAGAGWQAVSWLSVYASAATARPRTASSDNRIRRRSVAMAATSSGDGCDSARREAAPPRPPSAQFAARRPIPPPVAERRPRRDSPRAVDYSLRHVRSDDVGPTARPRARIRLASRAVHVSVRVRARRADRHPLEIGLVVSRRARACARLRGPRRVQPVRAVAAGGFRNGLRAGCCRCWRVAVAMPIIIFVIYVYLRPSRARRPSGKCTAADGRLRDAHGPRRLPVALDRTRRPRAAEGSARARAGARARPGAQRSGSPGARRATEPPAGPGGAALPVQHAREHPGAGGSRLAEGAGRAAKPGRIPARRGAAAP